MAILDHLDHDQQDIYFAGLEDGRKELYEATGEELEVLVAYWQEQWESAKNDRNLKECAKRDRQVHADSRIGDLLQFLGGDRYEKAKTQGILNFLRKHGDDPVASAIREYWRKHAA